MGLLSYFSKPNDAYGVATGFPTDLAPTVRSVLSTFGHSIHYGRSLKPSAGDEIAVLGENLVLPRRVYNIAPDSETFDSFSIEQRDAARCILSRHHDGHVRQKQVKPLVASQHPWGV